MARELTTGDIARRHGIDRKTAWRWMRQLHELHPDIVFRRGARGIYVTTEEGFATIAPLAAEPDERRVREVEDQLETIAARADVSEVAIAEQFRRNGLERPSARGRK